MERPILFSGEMVRAILEGRKTMTRRVVKNHPLVDGGFTDEFVKLPENLVAEDCPYGLPGDRLWVRETWSGGEDFGTIIYKADGTELPKCNGARWHPSIHMFRRFSRITLEITNVRVERLQDITEDDARTEGVECVGKTREFHEPLYKNYFLENNPDRSAKYSFRTLWDSINGQKHPWSSNPFVWVIEFKKI